jgi:hypothetical protein
MQNPAGSLLTRASKCSTRSLRHRHPFLRRHTPSSQLASAKRRFSVGPRCLQRSRLPFTETDVDHDIPFYNDQPLGEERAFQIKIPYNGKRMDAEAWIDTLEPFLPSSLRITGFNPQRELSNHLVANPGRNVSHWLAEARFSGLDLLSYLGIVCGRWEVAEWIVSVVSEGHRSFEPIPEDVRTALSKHWVEPTPEHLTPGNEDRYKTLLDRLTSLPFKLEQSTQTNITPFSFEDLTFEANRRYIDRRRQKLAIGQIWQSLGYLILKAAASSSTESAKIMPHVLAMIATLHHHDIIPESVYSYTPNPNLSALQQPPTLHLLSSRILTALSDAAWNVRQASATTAMKNGKAQYAFLRNELPGTRYKTPIGELRPEIWLEFVLWSCLHGGWVMEGANILKRLQESSGTSSWSLISWRNIIESGGIDFGDDSSALWTKVIDVMEGTTNPIQNSPQALKLVEKTISSEIIAAYVDGMINVVHVGVGQRGVPVDIVLGHVKRWKQLLGRHNMGLGYTTWVAIVQRFVECGGLDIERNPTLMLEVLSLVEPFERELEAINVPRDENSGHPTPIYVFDATAITLGLYHRVMQAHVDVGAVEDVLGTFNTLQQYTDLNQRRSIEKFFRVLKEQRPQGTTTGVSFTSPAGLPADEYPEFFPRIPPYVLSPLVDLLTDAHVHNFQKWLVYSQDLDGPIIPASLYGEPAVAPALIRFATISQQKELLGEVLKLQSSLTREGALRLPRRVLSALLETQIQRRRWDHVHKILSMTSEYRDSRIFHPDIAACLAKQIMLLQSAVLDSPDSKHSESLARATEVFKALVQGGYGNSSEKWSMFEVTETMHTMIAVLSSINPAWATFCEALSHRSGNQPFRLPRKYFNTILEGVVELSGVEGGRQLWETWCRDVSYVAAFFGAEIPAVPTQFTSRANEYFNVENRVSLDDLPGGPLQFQGRLVPDFSTLRIILSKLMHDDDFGIASRHSRPSEPTYTKEEMVQWCLVHFKAFGLREQEAERNIKQLQATVEWAKTKTLESDLDTSTLE